MGFDISNFLMFLKTFEVENLLMIMLYICIALYGLNVCIGDLYIPQPC